MHYVGGVGADHHKYIILGIDLDVVKEQSRKQADKGESSYLHWHAADVSCYGHNHYGYGNTPMQDPPSLNASTQV